MALNNPNEPTSSFPNQPGSAFSFNFNPQYIAQLSANPTNAANGGQAPSGFANLNQQSNQNNSQNNNPVSVAAPQLLKTGANLVGNASGVTSGITGAINNFGATIGFSNPAAASLGAISSDAAFGTAGAASGGLDAYAAAQGGTEAVSSAVAAADAAATPGAVGSLSGASLSGVLGAAGLGYIGGGILAKAIGGSPIGGSIGGAIGAGAGMAFGGAGAAALGLELGSFAGPIGAIVGGIGGALFGSLFGGGGNPTSADNYGAMLTPTGSTTAGGGGSKNPGQYAGFGQQGVNQLSTTLQGAASSLGIQFNPKTNIDVGISTQHGGAYMSVSGPNVNKIIYYNQNDPSSVADTQKQIIQLAAQDAGYTNTDALNSWYKSYTSGTLNNTAPVPSVPTNPNPTGTSDFQKFVDNYKAQQSVHAA